MKKYNVWVAVVTVSLLCGVVWLGRAQSPVLAQRYEVAVVKWDGGDKLLFLTP